MNMKTSLTLLSILCFIGFPVVGQSQALDQSQLQYDAAQSARNLPGWSTWQSFTAGLTGTLSQIDQGFVNPMTGAATLNIYTGNGTEGDLLYTAGVTISGTGIFWSTFIIASPVNITAGQMYTWEVVPTQGGGLPDPYAVQVTWDTTSYPDGESTAGVGFDYVFRTFVTLTVGVASIDVRSSETGISPNPFSTETVLRTDALLQNATLTMYNAQGQQVRQMGHLTGQTIKLQRGNLPSGIYSMRLTENDQIRSVHKLVITEQ